MKDYNGEWKKIGKKLIGNGAFNTSKSTASSPDPTMSLPSRVIILTIFLFMCRLLVVTITSRMIRKY